MRQFRSMLVRCRDQFKFYAAQHMAKTPPQEDKAAVNHRLAIEISDVLATEPDADYNLMVATLKKPGEAILEVLRPIHADALHMAIGACGEAGELADAIKKWTIYGKELDRANVVEELGDLEFFMQGIREITGISREETLEANMSKLAQRYAGLKYSDAQAIARADKEASLFDGAPGGNA